MICLIGKRLYNKKRLEKVLNIDYKMNLSKKKLQELSNIKNHDSQYTQGYI